MGSHMNELLILMELDFVQYVILGVEVGVVKGLFGWKSF